MDRHLYLLLLGLLAGLLLGPCVLGRHFPHTYRQLFTGDTEAQKQLDDFDRQAQLSHQRLSQSGVTNTALVEFDLKTDHLRQAYIIELQKRQTQHRQWLQSQMTTLVLAVFVLLLIKTLISQKHVHLRSRCDTASYALLSIWVALIIAQPVMFKSLPWMFLMLLVAVSLIASFMPMSTTGRSD